MYADFDAQIPLRFTSAYAPQADSPTQGKELFYEYIHALLQATPASTSFVALGTSTPSYMADAHWGTPS